MTNYSINDSINSITDNIIATSYYRESNDFKNSAGYVKNNLNNSHNSLNINGMHNLILLKTIYLIVYILVISIILALLNIWLRFTNLQLLFTIFILTVPYLVYYFSQIISIVHTKKTNQYWKKPDDKVFNN